MTREELRDYVEEQRSLNMIPYHVYSTLIDGIDTLEQEPRWIPVSERLPEDGEIVLFSTKTDIVFEGRYFEDNTNAFNNVITAWMPLPKSYESQESKDKE